MPWGHKCEFLVTWDSTGVKSWIAGEGGGGWAILDLTRIKLICLIIFSLNLNPIEPINVGLHLCGKTTIHLEL